MKNLSPTLDCSKVRRAAIYRKAATIIEEQIENGDKCSGACGAIRQAEGKDRLRECRHLAPFCKVFKANGDDFIWEFTDEEHQARALAERILAHPMTAALKAGKELDDATIASFLDRSDGDKHE